MPVKLDWEIDDVDVPLPGLGAETGGGAGCRRGLRLLALLVLAAAIGLGYLKLKIQQKQSAVENQLRAVVELELKALLNGDQDLYLNQQDPDSRRWQSVQRKAFELYHQGVARGEQDETWIFPAYTGQAPVVRVEGDEGWALVETAHGESVWREVWFYAWTRSDGWRHTPFDSDWLGDEREHATPHLHFSYPKRDEALVVALAGEMEAWYEVLAPLLDVNLMALEPPLLAVEFVYRDPSRPGQLEAHWRESHPRTLLMPSLHLGHFSADDIHNLELRQRMAGYLVEALIARQAGLRPPDKMLPAEINALRHELRDWSVGRLAYTFSDLEWSAPPTPMVDALVAREGAQVVPRLAANLREPETLDQALAVANLDPPDPATCFAFLLVADSRAMRDHNLHDYNALADPGADKTWRDYRADQWSWQNLDGAFDSAWSPSRVKSVVFNGEVAWVEAETAWPNGVTQRQTHFFRQVGERWLLTSPDPVYFGEPRTTQTENLTFNYFERDAQWFDVRIPSRLQTILDRAAADLGVLTDGLNFVIEVNVMRPVTSWGSNFGVVNLASPSLKSWFTSPPDGLVTELVYPLLSFLSSFRFSDSNERTNLTNLASAVQNAIVQWEMERLLPGRAAYTWPPVDASRVAAWSLADLGTEEFYTLSGWERRWIQDGYRTLIEYLAETYGPGVVPMLLNNLSQDGGLDEWLRLSTGHSADEIEPGWRAWVLATYGD